MNTDLPLSLPIAINLKKMALLNYSLRAGEGGPLLGEIRGKLVRTEREIVDSNGQLIAKLVNEKPLSLTSACIRIRDPHDAVVGCVVCENMLVGRFTRLQVQVLDSRGCERFTFSDDSAVLSMARNVMAHVPVLDMLSSYMALPSYTLKRSGSDSDVAKMQKTGSLLEGNSLIKAAGSIRSEEKTLVILALLAIAMLERGAKE